VALKEEFQGATKSSGRGAVSELAQVVRETQIVRRERPRSKRWAAGGTKDLEQSDAGTSVWRVAVAAAGRDVYGDGAEA